MYGRISRKTRRFTLGGCDVLPADLARRRAIERMLEMHDGVDPQAQRRKLAEQSLTLREVIEHYITSNRTKRGKLRQSSIDDINK